MYLQLDILLVEERVSEVVLQSFEWLYFNEYCSEHNIVSHIFEALVQCGRDDPVGIDPWSSEQKIVRHASVNDLARHF